MKSTLIITDEEGQRSAELPKERIVLGTSAVVSIPLRSQNASLLPEHAVILWNPQRVTWMLSRASLPQAELSVNGRPLGTETAGDAGTDDRDSSIHIEPSLFRSRRPRRRGGSHDTSWLP